MGSAPKNAAILANLSALRAILGEALERAVTAENAIGAALGMDALLQSASALYTAALTLHRGGEP